MISGHKKNMPRRQSALENADYAAKAQSLRVGEGVKTSTRAECVGIIRALERIGAQGGQGNRQGVVGMADQMTTNEEFKQLKEQQANRDSMALMLECRGSDKSWLSAASVATGRLHQWR